MEKVIKGKNKISFESLYGDFNEVITRLFYGNVEQKRIFFLFEIAVWRSGLPREAHDLKTIVQIYLLHFVFFKFKEKKKIQKRQKKKRIFQIQKEKSIGQCGLWYLVSVF